MTKIFKNFNLEIDKMTLNQFLTLPNFSEEIEDYVLCQSNKGYLMLNNEKIELSSEAQYFRSKEFPFVGWCYFKDNNRVNNCIPINIYEK